MSSVLAVVMAAVFLWAAVAKFGDRKGTAAGFADLGLPQPELLSFAVPVSEISTALLLLAAPGWGGVVAFGLLAAFTVVLVLTIRSGRLVPCRCFGGSSDRPVSWPQVVRNGTLLLFAAAVTPLDRLAWPSVNGFLAAAGMVGFGALVTFLAARASSLAL